MKLFVLLGAVCHTFRGVIVFKQGGNNPLLVQNGTELLQFIEVMEYLQMMEHIQEVMKHLEETKGEKEDKIVALESSITHMEKLNKIPEENKTEFEELKEKVNQFRNEL